MHAGCVIVVQFVQKFAKVFHRQDNSRLITFFVYDELRFVRFVFTCKFNEKRDETIVPPRFRI